MNISSVTGIKQPASQWNELAREVTPLRIVQMLQRSATGDADEYLSLAIEMEERYLHYASVMQTRRNKIVGAEISVTSGDRSEAGQAIADAFHDEVIDSDVFRPMLLDMTDGISKGYSVIQPVWSTEGARWQVAEYQFIDQRYFTFDRETLMKLLLKSPTGPHQPIPAGRFIIHMPKVRAGVPIRAGLARPGAVAWLFVSAGDRQWASHVEVYGMPLRIGRYDPNMHGDDEIGMLKTAIRSLGHDAAAVLPHGMDLEILDGRATSQGTNIFESFVDKWDGSISKLVIGQRETTDKAQGGSRARAETLDKVREDIAVMDAGQAAATLRRDLAAPWVLYNYGPNAPIPKMHFEVEEPEDMVSFSTAIAPLIKVGLRVKADELRDKFNLSHPEESDEIVEMPTPEPQTAAGGLNAE